MSLKDLEKVQKENCDVMIPTKKNLYKWAKKHPQTTIAMALKRVEKIFDFSDDISFGNSGGKDSTVSANLLCLELNLRKLRVKHGIDRDGKKRIDPLDKKWANKRLQGMMTDAEVCFSDTNNYTKRFIGKMGPYKQVHLAGTVYNESDVVTLSDKTRDTALNIYNRVVSGEDLSLQDTKLTVDNCSVDGGLDLIQFDWICLPLSWQSGVSFNSGVLISWDKSIQNMWVQPMPTRKDIHGFDVINEDNIKSANPVRLDLLPLKAQEYYKEFGPIVTVTEDELVEWQRVPGSTKTVEAVGNFGRGEFVDGRFKPGCHEKEEQDDYSLWQFQKNWLLNDYDKHEIWDELRNRYEGIEETDVWFLTSDEHDNVTTSIISLRAEESLDRRVILSQGEYSTGQYANNNGVNNCSPVFDFTTSDIWRLLSYTDWDVNDVYQKLFEIGVAPADQRVGSLLNYAAVRQIATVKALEPDLYGRINGRFQNVEFMSQFSRSGYFKIGTPRDTSWDGRNHLKSGVSLEEQKILSDEYEEILKETGIPYERRGNEFFSTEKCYKGKPWKPFNIYLKSIEK